MSTSAADGLRITGLGHDFGALTAVCDVDLTVARGDVLCLLGPSGCGKSTLLRLVAGLEMVQRGRIEIDGILVGDATTHVLPEARPIGLVFQDYALFPHLDVRNNVRFGLPRNADTHSRVDALLDRVGMTGYAEAMPHTLSGGQQQRVALARALARTPAVMLLDEPFSGLDTRLREEVRQVTLEILRAADVATVMVTHDPHEALVAGDQVGVMNAGRLLQTGPPAEVYGHSNRRDIAEMFGPINRFTGTVRGGAVPTPLGPLPVDGRAAGHAVELAVRPESIALRPASDHGDGRLVEITEVTHEGTTVRLRLRCDDGTLLDARDLGHRRWQVAQSVRASVVEDGAMVFDS